MFYLSKKENNGNTEVECCKVSGEGIIEILQNAARQREEYGESTSICRIVLLNLNSDSNINMLLVKYQRNCYKK